MKKEYMSPSLKVENLFTEDVLTTSTPDNDTIQMSPGYEQNSLISSIGDFVFHFGS